MNLEELKAKAEAVKPRRWIGQWTRWGINGTYAGAGPTCVTAKEAQADAAFIAAASPERVLALIKAVEAAEAVRAVASDKAVPLQIREVRILTARTALWDALNDLREME